MAYLESKLADLEKALQRLADVLKEPKTDIRKNAFLNELPHAMKNPAYSLIFAFLMMTAIMLIASTSIQNTRNKLQYFADIEASSKARLAAESAAEQAILQIKDYNAGYEPSATTDSFCVRENANSTDCETYGGYEVFANAEMHDSNGNGYYYTPIPNTGTAAPSDECSILEADEDADHSCNWNKIMYGDSVTIPLYVDGTDSSLDANGDGYLNPYELGLVNWYLKVRTPCTNGSFEEDCNDGDSTTSDVRYELDDTTTGTETVGGEAVILWVVSGEDSSGNSLSIIPSDDTRTTSRGTTARQTINTEIYESLVNDRYSDGTYTVLYTDSSDSTSKYYTLYDNFNGTDIRLVNLQISIISNLIQKTSGDTIPYLEWQLVTESNNDSFSNLRTFILGDGQHQGNSGTYYYPYVISRSSIGAETSQYTLSN